MSSQKQYEEEWKKQLVKCIRCGTCRSVCPVFKEENNENTTARGKVRLLEAVSEGVVELTPDLQERFAKCLMCKACVKGCPSGVRTDELFLSARQATAEKNGLPFIKRMAFTGLRYRKLFDLGLRLGSVFQGLVMKRTADGRGAIPRVLLPGAGLNLRRVIPPLAEQPLRSMLPERVNVAQPKGTVAFFTGCMLNYIYPQAGKAIVRLLERNGWNVVLPEAQCCCGTPAFTSGDRATGVMLAEHNVGVFAAEAYDAIITGCASCGAALKSEYGHILPEGASKEQWQQLAAKVYDITTFLVERCELKGFGELPMRVTYHDACHLVRGMNVSKEPRQIFASIPSLDFKEMVGADECCGSGGTFSMSYYDVARKINDRKLERAEATGADCIVTGCSACRMHISDGLSQRGSKLQVLHTAELIEMAYEAAEKGVK